MAPQREQSPPRRIVLFDGDCGICSSWVQFVIRRDTRDVFRFAAIQSKPGRALYERHGHDPEKMRTMLLLKGGRAYARSDAAIEVARELRFPWNLLALFRIVPRPIRDWFYDLIARNRRRWFPKSGSCPAPTDEMRRRFLD